MVYGHGRKKLKEPYLVGGALSSLDDIFNGAVIAGNMAGGTHHAFWDAGAGYCIFNDIAVASEQALRKEGIHKILVLDLDVHQGDGTAEIFSTTIESLQNLHGENNFPLEKISDLDFGFQTAQKITFIFKN